MKKQIKSPEAIKGMTDERIFYILKTLISELEDRITEKKEGK